MEEKNKKAFAGEAKTYGQVDYWRFDEEYLVNKYFKKKGANLLILGCGGGRTIIPLQEKGFKITAIDIVPEMVAEAKKRAENLGVKILEMDAIDLKFSDNSFDYVFFPFHGIDNVYPDGYKCVREVRRVLKKGGVFIFNSHNRFFLKKLHKFYKKYDYYGQYKQYRFSFFNVIKLRKYFKTVKFKHRISMLDPKQANFKDKCYRLFPIFDRSIYFICKL